MLPGNATICVQTRQVCTKPKGREKICTKQRGRPPRPISCRKLPLPWNWTSQNATVNEVNSSLSLWCISCSHAKSTDIKFDNQPWTRWNIFNWNKSRSSKRIAGVFHQFFTQSCAHVDLFTYFLHCPVLKVFFRNVALCASSTGKLEKFSLTYSQMRPSWSRWEATS